MVPFCREWVRHPEATSLTSDSKRRLRRELVRAHPALWRPLCFAAIDSEFAQRRELRRYVERAGAA